MKKIRFNLIMVTIALICIGIVMIYSSSAIYAHRNFNDSAYFLKRHLIFLIVGLLFTTLFTALDYRTLQRFSKPAIVTVLILLILVLIPGLGKEVAGARRWFRFAGFSFQPSEFAQICMILYTADFLSREKGRKKRKFFDFLPLMMILSFMVLLVLMQPDLGTSFAIAAIVIIMVYFGGIPLKYISAVFLVGLPVLFLAIFSVPYRRMRIVSFLNPWLDPRGSGFQLIQSQIALGSGGIFGLGLGQSKQKLFYLPAAHTDFIFSIIAEELGLLGSLFIIGLFIFFILQVAKIINRCRDVFGRIFALGLASMITFKAIINMAVSCGVIPTKGLPLPFISYGGTSLVVDLISVGIILNISARSDIKY